jgi:hypothetical protein
MCSIYAGHKEKEFQIWNKINGPLLVTTYIGEVKFAIGGDLNI